MNCADHTGIVDTGQWTLVSGQWHGDGITLTCMIKMDVLICSTN